MHTFVSVMNKYHLCPCNCESSSEIEINENNVALKNDQTFFLLFYFLLLNTSFQVLLQKVRYLSRIFIDSKFKHFQRYFIKLRNL